MAKHVYCDQSLGSGSDNGTSWINAYRLLSVAMDSTNVLASDTLWVKNNASIASTVNFIGSNTYSTNPPAIYGVKSATSATPPTNSDLIPGLRTNNSTLAYDQTGANAPPQLTVTGNNDITCDRNFSIVYGLRFIGDKNLTFGGNRGQGRFEECYFQAATTILSDLRVGTSSSGNDFHHTSKNCKFVTITAGAQFSAAFRLGLADFDKCIFDINASGGQLRMENVEFNFTGCDFSAQSHPLVQAGGGDSLHGSLIMNNCKINASSTFVTGSIIRPFRSEFTHVSSASGKTTGQTFQEVDIITDNGNVVEELTRFRTNGADDGGSGEWSLAFTPGIDGTRDNLVGLIGPKMPIEVFGDGTAQTITVYIANSSASTDYQDDEVWLVARSPSESGTADYDFYTTQMDLLATPANVTDDTGSTWGSGANNHQKLEITLSPDYDGIIECWVVFAKNFAASPETLYVDPLPVLS